MLPNLNLVVLWTSGVAVTVLAIWLGGLPEKIGATLNLVCAVAAEVAHLVWGSQDAGLALLSVDFILAMGFLGLAVRYASVWLGAAMLFQAIQFSLHAFYMVAERPHDLLYYRVNNIDTIGISLALVIGTIMAWRRRLSQARNSPPAANTSIQN